MNTIEARQATFTAALHPAPTLHVAPIRAGLRSVGAVLGGLISTVLVTTIVDVALHASGVFPAPGERMVDSLFLLALAYRIAFNTGGCYLAARLAVRGAARHALALGGIGTVLATVGAIVMWDAGPAWYSLANVAVALPCAWLAARLFTKRTEPARGPAAP